MQSTLFVVNKVNGTQRRAVVSPRRMHCMYSGMAKGTSRAEASEKIKPVALAIFELCKSEGIGQAGRQLVSWRHISLLAVKIICEHSMANHIVKNIRIYMF